MELVLDLKAPGAGENGGNREDAGNARTAGLPWVARLLLAAAAVAAAWYIMSDGAFGEIASRIIGHAQAATALPGPLGAMLAGLPGAG
jgi:hypothetical protein